VKSALAMNDEVIVAFGLFVARAMGVDSPRSGVLDATAACA